MSVLSEPIGNISLGLYWGNSVISSLCYRYSSWTLRINGIILHTCLNNLNDFIFADIRLVDGVLAGKAIINLNDTRDKKSISSS